MSAHMQSEGADVSSSISPTVLRVRFAAVISEDVQSDDSLDDSLYTAAHGPVSPCARELNNEHQRNTAGSSSAEATTTISEAYDEARSSDAANNALENNIDIHNNISEAEDARSPSLVSRRVRFRARTRSASPLGPRTTDTAPSTPPPPPPAAATEADTDPLVSPPQSAPGGWDSVPHTEDEEQPSHGRSALLQHIRAGQASRRGQIVPASSPTPTTESLTYSLLDRRWTSMRSLGSGSGSGSGCTSNREGTSSGNAEEEEEYFAAAGPVLAQDTRSQLLTRWRNSSPPPFPSASHSLPSNDDDDDDDDDWSLADGDNTHTSTSLSLPVPVSLRVPGTVPVHSLSPSLANRRERYLQSAARSTTGSTSSVSSSSSSSTFDSSTSTLNSVSSVPMQAADTAAIDEQHEQHEQQHQQPQHTQPLLADEQLIIERRSARFMERQRGRTFQREEEEENEEKEEEEEEEELRIQRTHREGGENEERTALVTLDVRSPPPPHFSPSASASSASPSSVPTAAAAAVAVAGDTGTITAVTAAAAVAEVDVSSGGGGVVSQAAEVIYRWGRWVRGRSSSSSSGSSSNRDGAALSAPLVPPPPLPPPAVAAAASVSTADTNSITAAAIPTPIPTSIPTSIPTPIPTALTPTGATTDVYSTSAATTEEIPQTATGAVALELRYPTTESELRELFNSDRPYTVRIHSSTVGAQYVGMIGEFVDEISSNNSSGGRSNGRSSDDRARFGCRWSYPDGRRFGTGRTEYYTYDYHIPGGQYALEFAIESRWAAAGGGGGGGREESQRRRATPGAGVGAGAGEVSAAARTTSSSAATALLPYVSQYYGIIRPASVSQLRALFHSNQPHAVRIYQSRISSEYIGHLAVFDNEEEQAREDGTGTVWEIGTRWFYEDGRRFANSAVWRYPAEQHLPGGDYSLEFDFREGAAPAVYMREAAAAAVNASGASLADGTAGSTSTSSNQAATAAEVTPRSLALAIASSPHMLRRTFERQSSSSSSSPSHALNTAPPMSANRNNTRQIRAAAAAPAAPAAELPWRPPQPSLSSVLSASLANRRQIAAAAQVVAQDPITPPPPPRNFYGKQRPATASEARAMFASSQKYVACLYKVDPSLTDRTFYVGMRCKYVRSTSNSSIDTKWYHVDGREFGSAIQRNKNLRGGDFLSDGAYPVEFHFPPAPPAPPTRGADKMESSASSSVTVTETETETQSAGAGTCAGVGNIVHQKALSTKEIVPTVPTATTTITAKGQEDTDSLSLCCVICLDAPKTHCFVPCGHITLCGACSDIMNTKFPRSCPICKAPSMMIMKVYN